MARKLKATPSIEKKKSIPGEVGESKEVQPVVEKKDAEKKDAEKKDAEKEDAEKKDAEKKDAEKKDAEKEDAEAKKRRYSVPLTQTKIFIVIAIFAFISLMGLIAGLSTSLKVAEHLEKLPEYLEDAEKDYNNQKSKYQSIFRKSARSIGGWQLFGWSLYYMSNEKKTWHDAERFCRSRDAHLTSILTEREQDYVTFLFNQSVWVGLSDTNVEGTWEWADGSKLTSQYWSPGNPTPSEGYGEMEQDCAFIDPSSGQQNWKDDPCHELKGWICKESLSGKNT